LPPSAYGPFELVDRISVGGMAEIFRARQLSSNQIVALKRILPSVAEDDEFIALFHDEARIASRLTHQNIASIIDVGQVNSSHYIALEYIEGKPLRTLIDRASAARTTLPVELAVHVLAEVAQGLSYAHDRKDELGRPLGIVHRDVSPQNVMISFDGEVKLIDFGIAKAAGKITRTHAGVIKGKLGYMSPEQVSGAPIDRRADVFALGICLWESLTSERLFEAPNELLAMEKIRSGQPAPPSQLNPAVSAVLDGIVLKALAKDPNQRYATASDFEKDLRAFARMLPAPGDGARLRELMSRMFPAEAAARAPGNDQENARMSDKGGSDLDVFNGLAKRPSREPPSTSQPRSGPVPPPLSSKQKTLLGMTAPMPPSGRNSAPPLPSRPGRPPIPSRPPVSRPPGPPPSRASQPGRTGSLPPPPVPPMSRPGGPPLPMPGPLPPKPPPAGAAPVDMDWDDEDEKTAVFDKQGEQDAAQALLRSGPPIPAAGAPSSRLGLGGAALASASGGAAAAPPSMPRPPGAFGPGPMSGGAMPAAMQPAPAMPAPIPEMAIGPYAPVAQPSGGAGRVALMAIAALLSVGLVAAMVVYFAMPRQGSMVVTVAGPGNKSVDAVQVFVDGAKKCDTSPCRVGDLGPGTHMVKVAAAGYQATADQAVRVEGGEEAVLNVTLARSSEGTGIRVPAASAGLVKLYVDNKEIGPLPQELKDMTPGNHVIKIAGDRYEPYEKRISVAADEMQSVEAKLKVIKGLATIKAGDGADGAKVLLVSGNERRPIPKLPIKIDITTDKPWSIVATKKGFEDFKKPIVFDDGQAEATFLVELFEKGKQPPPKPVGVVGKQPPRPTPAEKPVEKPAEKPVAAAGTGTLNINSIPVSNVILDGRPLGTTPRVGLSVPAGNHTVVFVHAEHGRKVRSVNVPAGGTATAAVRFP
jgi:eukaryotic-like serine/threonine-protein kinase